MKKAKTAVKKSAKKTTEKKPATKKAATKKVESLIGRLVEFDYEFPNRKELSVKGFVETEKEDVLGIKLTEGVQGFISFWNKGEFRAFKRTAITNLKTI